MHILRRCFGTVLQSTTGILVEARSVFNDDVDGMLPQHHACHYTVHDDSHTRLNW